MPKVVKSALSQNTAKRDVRHSRSTNPKNYVITMKRYKSFAYLAAAVSVVVFFATVYNNVSKKKCNWNDWGETRCLGTDWPATAESVSKIDVHDRDGYGNTPLHLAVERPGGTVEVVETLIQAGANVNASNAKGATPLHQSVYSNNLEIVTALIESGADVDARAQRGRTPLHVLSYTDNPNLAILTALVSKGADVNAREEGGYAPLHLLATQWEGGATLAAALIQAGADADARTESGESPLHLVSARTDPNEIETIQVAMAVLNGGADINARDENGATPLHAALCHENKKPNTLAVFFLREGADVHARDDRGNSPLHCAARYPSAGFHVLADKVFGDKVLVELLKAGADANAKNKEGQTPLDLIGLSSSRSSYVDVDLRLELARRLYNINRNFHEER